MTLTPLTTLAQESLKKYFFSTTGVSAQAKDTEDLFMYILWINILSFILLMILLGWFILKYHRSKQSTNYQVSAAHHTPLELTWSIVPLLVMIPIFYWGFTGYSDKISAPVDSEEIMINGSQWRWTVTYRNGAQPQNEQPILLTELAKTLGKSSAPEFVVPYRRPVKLILNSSDVIHAFYIPDFRTKMDVIPNRYTSMWFFPEKLTNERDPKTGQLHLPTEPEAKPHIVFCAEYCGQDHSDMMAQMRVVPPEEFEATIKQWLDYSKDTPMLKVGEMVYTRKGCSACHTTDGGKSTGPTWKNMYGDTHEYSSGPPPVNPTVNENTLREDILYSQKRILKGYPSSMPIFAGQITPMELDAVILYIKSLSDKYKPETVQPGAKTVKQYKDDAKPKEGGTTPPAGGAGSSPGK